MLRAGDDDDGDDDDDDCILEIVKLKTLKTEKARPWMIQESKDCVSKNMPSVSEEQKWKFWEPSNKSVSVLRGLPVHSATLFCIDR